MVRASFLLCLGIFLSTLAAPAQSTIFNIPTADTTPRGSWGFEADFIAKPVSYRDGGYQTYGYRVAYGAGHKTEIGSNFYYTWDGSESAAQAEFSLKQKVFESETRGMTASGGVIAFVPLRSKIDRTAVMVYGNVGKTIERAYGMTLTGGVYHVFRGTSDFGTRTGVMAAVVQPINQKFDLVADWFSGNNRLGYVSAGLNYNISKKQYLLTGYSFGNSGRGNNALAAYYGFTF